MNKGWERKKLGEVCEVLDNLRKPITKRDRIEGKYPYYGATGILSYVDNFIFDEKLVLIGEDGAKWDSGDKTAFIADGKYWVNNHAHVVRPNRKTLLDEWLIYFLNFSDLTPFISGMTVPKLNQERMRSIPIPLPPLPEQHRIVSILDQCFSAIDKAKANAEQNLKNVKEVFESYLQGVFASAGSAKGLISKDENDSNDGQFGQNESPESLKSLKTNENEMVIKSEWEVRKLGEISKINYGYTEKAFFENIGPKFLRITDIQENGVDWATVPYCKCSDTDVQKYKLETGDIVFARTGATTGKSYLLKNPPNAVFASYLIRLKINKKEDFIPEFVAYFFQTKSYWEKINEGISGSAQGGFNATKLSELDFSFPKSKAEQQLLVRQLDALHAETQKLETIYQKKIDNFAELKKSILGKAFRGELNYNE